MRTREEWKNAKGYELKYKVSSLGRIYSFRSKKFLKQCVDSTKYFRVNLRINGKSQVARVHRLVAINFIPNPENKRQVNHIDANKLNNKLSNLEWCTNKENMKHANDNGLIKNLPRGVNHFRAKLNPEKVKKIISLYNAGGYSYRKLGKIFQVNGMTISNVLKGKTWSKS